MSETTPAPPQIDTSGMPPPPRACRPPWWARGGHAQTIWGHLLPSSAPALVPSRDGVDEWFVPVSGDDWLHVLERRGTSGVVVALFHGLGGDANADYVRRTAALASARGHTVLAAEHRGCGLGRGLAAHPYHSGSADDVAAVLAAARERLRPAHLVAIGFSLSGNALLLLLARAHAPRTDEHRPATTPDAALCVNPPADLARAAEWIGRPANRVYERRFVARARRHVAERARTGRAPLRVEIPRGIGLRAFDDLYTAPASGFADAADYYARCSTLSRLTEIRRPTVILTAADDPFVPPDVAEAPRSADVHVHLERSGGHLGYLTRSGLGARRWLDEALAHYLDAVLARRAGSALTAPPA